jgi:hypothetical protein
VKVERVVRPEVRRTVMVDPRGVRFAAGLTSAALAAVLLTGSVWLLAAQTAVFIVGSVAGVRYAPYGLIFRYFVRPRLGPPAAFEDPVPPRFAQAVGAFFGVLGSVGFLAGVDPLGYAAVGTAFAAAFINAAFNFCLGCQTYLVIRSITAGGVST